MVKKIAIYGSGGFGSDVHFLLDTINKIQPTYDILGYFDDTKEIGVIVNGLPIIGGLGELNNYNEKIFIVLAIGDSNVLEKIFKSIDNAYVEFPNIIHPQACIDIEYLRIGIGNVVNFSTIISRNTTIGNFNIINSNVSIGHDVQIGSFNVFSPSVSISGNVQIASKCFFGLKSSIIEKVNIEDEVRVGAHSLIIRRAKRGNMYFGVPATKQ